MNEWGVVKRMFKDFLQNIWRKKVIGLFLWWMILTVFSVIEPLFFREIISFVEESIKGSSLIFSDVIYTIFAWGLFIIVFLILRGFYIYGLWQKMLINEKKGFLKGAEKLLRISHNDYLQIPKGAVYKKVNNWLEDVWFLISPFFRDVFPSMVSILISSWILFIIDWRMAIVTLSFLPVSIILWYFITVKTSSAQSKIEILWNRTYEILWDGFNNGPLIKIFNLNKIFLLRLSQIWEEARVKQLKVNVKWVFFDNFSRFIIMISRFLVLWFGVYFILEESLSLATLFLFFAYIDFIYGPVSYIFWESADFQKKLARIWKYYQLLDENEFEDDKGEKFKQKVEWNIEFRDVDFSYIKWKKVLKNLNFKIKKWETVAFVWTTGSGKSTITSLLYSFWDVKKWKILIDEQNISKLKKSELRRHLGIVMQDNLLFNVSIKENLSLIKKDCSDEDIENALKLAQCDFVHNLEKWIDTIVGERGLKLSGWEKQRISIARLILKNPEILILDEATSALDNTTEKLIQKSLDNLMKGRTSIIIAHRLSTIKKVDKIFVLDNGTIVEQWNYDELMKKKGKFYSLSNPEKMVIL